MAPNIGILLVGHGTASPLGVAEFTAVADRLGPHFPGHPLAFGFLEHARPTINEAVELLFQQGVASIAVAPLLLFAAGHAKRDIPHEALLAAEKRGLTIAAQAEVLGRSQRIIDLALQRYRAAANSADAALILVGRGSSDPEAQAETAALLADCQRIAGIPRASHAFLAMAEPSLPAVVESIGAAAPPCAVILPHLLFHGRLIENCRRAVDEAAARYPKTTWKLAERLGADDAVILTAVDRIRDALSSVGVKNSAT